MQYRQCVAVLTAAALLLTGCQKPPAETPEEELSAQTLAEPETPAPDTTPLTATVRCDPIALPEALDSIWQTARTADGILALGNTADGQELCLHIRDDLQTMETAVLTPPAGEGDFFLSGRLYAVDNGDIWAIAVLESHGGLSPYDPKTDDRSYDFDAWDRACEFRYLLCRYAENGTLVSAIPADGLAEHQVVQGNYRYNPFQSFSGAGSELYLSLVDGTLLHIAKETGEVREVANPERESNPYSSFELLDDRDGRVLRVGISADEPDEFYIASELNLRISEYDTASEQEGAELYHSMAGRYEPVTPMTGFGDYRFCMASGEAFRGIRDDGTQETLIDWSASDLVEMSVVPLNETQFFAYGENDDGKVEAYRLTRKHEAEIEEAEVLTLSVFDSVSGNAPLSAFVRKFNREHDGYRIEILEHPYESVEDYEVTTANYEKAYDEFRLSLLTDNAPDIVLITNHTELLSLGKRGAFLDLYALMDSDALLNRSTLVPNVLTALESPEGAVYGLPTVFCTETMVAKTRICDKENWTLDDMIALYDSADHDVYRWQTKEQIFTSLLYGMDFTDERTGTAHFDSPEFIQVLEFADRFPAQLDEPVKDYESRQATERMEKFYMDEFLSFSRDEQYLTPHSLDCAGDTMACGYSYAKYHTFGGEEITFVGYPSDNGQGCKLSVQDEIAVTSRCKQPQLAWEFVKSYLQRQDANTNGYSIIDARFEQDLDSGMHITEFDGEEIPYYEDDGMKIYPMTQAERDRVERYVRASTTLMPEMNAEWSILQEEAEKYFAGDQTAEAAAQKIQNRVKLMLAENQ